MHFARVDDVGVILPRKGVVRVDYSTARSTTSMGVSLVAASASTP